MDGDDALPKAELADDEGAEKIIGSQRGRRRVGTLNATHVPEDKLCLAQCGVRKRLFPARIGVSLIG